MRLGSDEATAEDTDAVFDMAVIIMRSHVRSFGSPAKLCREDNLKLQQCHWSVAVCRLPKC